MSIETTTADVPQIRLGARFASVAVLFLAAIAVLIGITFDPTGRVGVAEVGQASVVDYALRHAPIGAQPTDYGLHDYALRHSAIASATAIRNSPDYALRHPTTDALVAFTNSPDYALRHLDG